MIIDKSNYKEYMEGSNILNCHNSNITEIRYLPEGLIHLYCNGNELTSLPELPKNLTWLNCNDNQLTSLPELPKKLLYLNCKYNKELPYCGVYNDKEQIKTFIKKLRLKESLITFLS